MAPGFAKKNYSQIYQELGEAQSWLKWLNIKTENTRFEEIIQNVQRINDKFIKDPSSVISGDIDIETFWYSLTDAYSIIKVYESMKSLKSDKIPRKKLKDSLHGPLLPNEEVPSKGNVNSRNLFFELELAANLMKSNISVIGFEDVTFAFEGYRFCVQCKRLLSKNNIAHNIKHAYDQLNKPLSEDEKCRGIIALSIEKLFDIDELVLDVENTEQAEELVNKTLDNFRKQYDCYWKNFLNIRFICVILAYKSLMMVKTSGIHSLIYMLDFIPLQPHPQLQFADSWLIKSLESQLGASCTE